MPGNGIPYPHLIPKARSKATARHSYASHVPDLCYIKAHEQG
jgi:hypothetical protein